MQLHPPTQTRQSAPLWEGDQLPPLRMRDEKRSVLEPPASAPVPAPAPEAKRITPPASKLKHQMLALACVAVLSVPAYYLASRFIVTAVVIQGRSMAPTLKDGEHYFLNRWRYFFLPPQRGDVVVIKDPGHNDFAVKRIVARPYDWLNLKNGVVYINGKRLEEPYINEAVRTDAPDYQEKWIQLGRNQYYVLGDNRANSEDSRFYGVVHRKNILGLLIK
jgi:signal peptidase I